MDDRSGQTASSLVSQASSCPDASILAEEAGFDKNIVSALQGKSISDVAGFSSEDLEGLGISGMSSHNLIWLWLRSVNIFEQEEEKKVFNDPIHGLIEFHPLLVAIIDTPQCQRLRDIKQLGGGYHVFPGAAHNRFEHSLGVCHLAGEFVKSLQLSQPELAITPCDILCVQIAGLCHDLGHGPFSHLFDGIFIPSCSPETKWKHEDGSVKMFDHLIRENNLMPSFAKYGLDESDVEFIKELITGVRVRGRLSQKHFLYEIVANKTNGIDVDKWDYFARDCHSLGVTNNFDHQRFIKFARVIKVKGTPHICCRDKEVLNIYEMFQTRITLHKKAYQHKTTLAIERMISDGLHLANEHFHLKGTNNRSVKISEAVNDMVAYTNLTDSIVPMILSSTNDNLKDSQRLLGRVKCRKIYKYIGSTQSTADFNEDDALTQIVKLQANISDKAYSSLYKGDLFFATASFDYGMKDKNPIDEMYFYTKADPQMAFPMPKNEVSRLLPSVFAETFLYLYCKSDDVNCCKIAKRCFNLWCEHNGFKLMTPYGRVSLPPSNESHDDSPHPKPAAVKSLDFNNPKKRKLSPSQSNYH